MTAPAERLAAVLSKHHPTRGMAPSMGVTCECGYWTGSEPEAGGRPLPWGRDQLDLHRGRIMQAEIDAAVTKSLRDAADEIDAVIADGDVAAAAAHVPGEVGRASAILYRVSLYEDPADWLRARADSLDSQSDSA